jgi:hypothetical protein
VTSTVICDETAYQLTIGPKTASGTLQPLLAAEFRQNISGVLIPMVVTGLGAGFRYQEGDIAIKYRAGEADIAQIVQPRTTASLASNSVSEPRPQSRVHLGT